MIDRMAEPAKHVGDIVSVATVGAALAGWLPSLAAVFTIIWTGIRIWETKTVRRLTGRGDG